MSESESVIYADTTRDQTALRKEEKKVTKSFNGKLL